MCSKSFFIWSGFGWFLQIVSSSRSDDTAGCFGHSSREKVAGHGHQCGEPERREEGWSLPVFVPGSGEQEGEEGDPGLWTGQSQRHNGAGREGGEAFQKLEFCFDMLGQPTWLDRRLFVDFFFHLMESFRFHCWCYAERCWYVFSWWTKLSAGRLQKLVRPFMPSSDTSCSKFCVAFESYMIYFW